ncbi:MAG: hypothetical protein P1Q69_13895 [Candidatus Thorarchaeota archaeon]|nr:hypothetical protein [Candidatus Thorarchaeota archaeon]
MRNRGLVIIVLFLFLVGSPSSNVDDFLNASVTIPRDNSISQSNGEDILELRWWSRETPSPQILEDNAIIEGDRITVEAVFEDSMEHPDLRVEEVSWSVSRGFIKHRTGELLVPDDEAYEPFIMGLNISQLVWERIDGIQRGDNVRLTLFHDNTDTDVLVYWADIDPSLWFTDGGLTGRQMATPVRPEIGSFIADHDGAIMVGMYSYDHQNGTYNLTVDTSENDSGNVHGNSVCYETWSWGRNDTLSMGLRGTTANGTIVSKTLSNLTINGFFEPTITDVDVLPNGLLRYIVWDVFDRNQNDVFEYEVLISLDGGVSFQLMASGITEKFYEWNTGGFDAFETCIVQIRVTDSTGFRGTGFSETFSIGANADYTGIFWFATSSSGNVTCTYGTPTNPVSWEIWIQHDTPMQYQIILDDEVIQEGWTVSGLLEIAVDDLALGTHKITCSMMFGPDRWNDTVFVQVIPNPAFKILQLIGSVVATSIISIAVVLYEFYRWQLR